MTSHMFARAAGAVLVFALASGAATARSDEPPPESVCSVLGTAARYVNTTVTVRGVALSEGKSTTLTDAQCKGALDLTMDEKSAAKRDIASFRRTVANKGTRADATVFGRFKATGDAQRPYAIDVYSVREVNELPVALAEGG
jgi:hypothetical protein